MNEQVGPHAGGEERLDVDTYLGRYAGVTGRRELVDGHVVTIAAERVRHTRTKAHVWSELRRAVREAGVPCEAFADALSVRIDERNTFEPDALVNRGDSPDDESLEANSAVVTADSRRVVHFARDGEGTPRVAIVPADRALRFDPPGIELDVGAFFARD